ARIVEMINSAGPDILWVGLGSPKQDIWMYEHKARINAPVMIGVGAAFDFVAGTKKQAPKWMQRSGFEWLFRLSIEPKRLFKRYIFGNALFLYLICAQAIRSIFVDKDE
ncbi:MAG TPA: WecB/TagA/CpsF family glycosyltransferase, partial [Candidatus Omnitrophota bacterium]|nr:WecB/TagA/CpsF family glycosyltransferase [Candidatus Omnitrophota bacterium]